jgi:hypothetical protein
MRHPTKWGSALLTAATAAVAMVAAEVSVASVAAQETAGGIDLSASAGLFADYPGGLVTGAARDDTRGLALEASLVASFGIGEVSCAYPGAPAPPDGGLYNRATLDDQVAGQSFVATTLAAVLEPLPHSMVGPRLRLGGGRLWDKRLWTWLYGAGLRFNFGRNAITADIERWHLGYDLSLELWIYRADGPDELQRVEVLPRRSKPYLLRLGWTRTIG